jgi:hypothetical protein
MIRRFIGMMIFSSTVTIAAFGQNVFGREDLINWAHRIQHEGPRHVQVAWRETDKMLAQLAPEAGQEEGALRLCLNDDPEWLLRTMNTQSSPFHTPL